ncbi:helix-turn-helix domain-containing protein [Paenibacillus abyssi]|uniref:HTH cro/C1-type domain-containing protein n=2 Tax=Paenibacillus abyssi TaxID=1340531 RepID=A0A917G1G9_9BACL|nr:helix-turn-helix transcriptional regulator [Paenibacillus abyssi]GGG17799.1 hypothetical protein GCM10010916_38260 [Paenibacillus abyssi]
MKRRVMTGEGPQYDPEKVGEAIRQMRNLANLTLSALSGKIGIPQSKLSYIETGKYKKVHNKDIERIAAGLKCKVDSLLNQSTLKDNPQDEKIAMDIDTIRSYLLLARNKEVAAMIQKLEAEVNTESIYYPLLLKVKGDYFRNIGDQKNALRYYDRLESMAQTTEEKITKKPILEAIIASISTIYEAGDYIKAIRKSLNLIDAFNKSAVDEWDLAREKYATYANLALFYLATSEIGSAKAAAQKAFDIAKSHDTGLLAHIQYLYALILFLNEEYKESERNLMEAIREFRFRKNTRLLTKALLAQHAFFYTQPDKYSNILTVLEQIVLDGADPCGETCKRNPLYHDIWNTAIERHISAGSIEKAKTLLDRMYALEHNNIKTSYLMAKWYEAQNDHDQYIQYLRRAIEEAEAGRSGVTPHEQGHYMLEYLANLVPTEKQLITKAKNSFQSNPPFVATVIKDLLTAPIS